MADFHFIRPLWLLLLIAAVLMPVLLRKLRSSDSGWSRIIPPQLLTPIISHSGRSGQDKPAPMLPLMFVLALTSVALAGPSWREAPTPLQQQNDSLVIVLDLSLSMLATDAEPNRLTVAKRKIRDILDARKGSLTSLIVYAADAHLVTPLTDDSQTIKGMLNVLEPVIMPAAGNRADRGIDRALRLLEQGAPGKGRVLLIADDVSEQYLSNIDTLMAGSPYTLSTLVVGTVEGGPIPLARQGFIRDNGDIVITRADPEAMAQLARTNGGESETLTITNADIKALALRSQDADEWQDSELGLTVNRWQDDGYWLLWLAIPIALLGWRRGAMIMLVFALLPLSPRPALAQSWDQLWLREDQRAPDMIRENPGQAAQTLQDPVLQGSALYRAENYEAAAEAFAKSGELPADYNRGNALAKAGKLEEAVKSYDKVLERNPEHEDAKANRELVEQLLKQQEQQQQNQSGQDQDSSDQQSGERDGEQDGEQGDEQQSQPSDSDQPQQNGENQPQENDESQPPQDEPEPEAGEGEPEEQNGQEQEPEQAEAPTELDPNPLSQGQEQWLRRVPDDPGGLLRRKFLQQYQQRELQTDKGDTPW